MRVFYLLTPYYGVLKPLVYWPYQSVRVLDVMNEHIYKKEECNNSLNAMHFLFKKVR